MKRTITILSVLSILAVFAGCLSKRNIRIISTNFSEEITRSQDLLFTFNMAVAPDSILNLWDSVTYIQFEPPVPGRFKWTANDAVIFSPSALFNPCCDYTAHLTSGILHLAGRGATFFDREISFHTPYLKLVSANAWWAVDETTGEVGIKIRLQFNNVIDAGLLSPLLKLTVNGHKVSVAIAAAPPSETVEISVPGPETADSEDIPLQIDIMPGLACGSCGWSTPKTITYQLNIPPKERLQVREMRPYFEAGKGIIAVLTTQPVMMTDLEKEITVTPATPFKIESMKDGFMIQGDFEDGKSYQVTLSGNVAGVFGKAMGSSYTQYVTFGEMEPYIAFTDKAGRYLSLKGNRNIGVRIVNIPQIKISVFKVFENNILHYLNEGKTYDWEYAEGRYYSSYDYSFRESDGRTVFSRVIDMRDLPRTGKVSLLNIKPEDIGLSDQLRGLYLLRVEAADKPWLSDVQMFAVSDLGLIVKEGNKNIFVFVNSIRDAMPVPGVTVSFVSSNNQVVFTAITDNNGVAQLMDKHLNVPDFNIAMITAQKENDFNYLFFDECRVETSRYDVGGKRTKDIPYDVFLYGDRDLYRPGDTVFFNAVVRTMTWGTESGIPVKIKVKRPDGKEFLAIKRTLDSQGSAEGRFYLPTDAMTGAYIMEVYSGNDVLLKSSRILVEEFMPDRIRVTAVTDKTAYRPDEEIHLDILAMNLFGTPAAGRNYEVNLQVAQKMFVAKDYPDFSFDVSLPKEITFEEVTRQGQTDAQGKATEAFTLKGYDDIGLLEGKIYTTVFDETGRPVNRLNTFNIYTQDVFYGIRRFDRWVDTRKPVVFTFVAVDRDGRPLDNVPVRVQIVQITWQSVIEHQGNSYRYVSHKVETVILDQPVTIGTRLTSFPFTPSQSGSYEVRVMKEGARSHVAEEFYAYGWYDTEYTSFEVSKEGQVIIESDKDEYRPGETARLLFKTPFDGKLLITVERDEVLLTQFQTTNNKAVSLDLRLNQDELPNVYVSATLIRPQKDNSIPLTVAHGYKSLRIIDNNDKLPLTVMAVDDSRSNRKQQVTVKTRPGADVTIAVVDEGILQVTAFRTPDPFEYFYQKRALEVVPYDLYAYLMPELAAASKTGGDLAAEMGRRMNPITSKRVRLLAFWSGIMRAGDNGECHFDVDIPHFSGSLRIMAVAYAGHRFASAEKMMKVADPLVLSTALPRFLSPGDRAVVPVTITNTTSKTATAEVTMTVKGPLAVEGTAQQQIKLEPNREGQVNFGITAGPGIGGSEVTAAADAFGETFNDETEVPVRPPAGLATVNGSGTVKAGDSTTFTINDDFISGTVASKIILSNTPLIRFSNDLSYLLRYPYGCTEQVISKAFPLIYYGDLAGMLEQKEGNRPYNPAYLVQEAIKKIQSLQIFNGGIMLWPECFRENWWVTAYAGHFLYEARKAGYTINEQVFDNIIRYLEIKSKEKSTWEYYFRDINGMYYKKTLADKEIFYSLYVMALNGNQNLSLMNYYKARTDEMDNESRYMLAAAFMLLGDRMSSQAVLPTSSGDLRIQRTMGGSFDSYVRDLALSLYTLLEVNPEDQQIPALGRMLSEELKKNDWYSTQDRAMALLALGKLASLSAEDHVEATLYAGGKQVGQYAGEDKVITGNLDNKPLKIVTQGTGMLYYFYDVRGVSVTGRVKEEDSYMEVRKAFYDRFGRPFTALTFHQNDLVVVKISVRSTSVNNMMNVAVTDLLPACFEIENPRITPQKELTWVKDRSEADYMDIRDDRITFFITEPDRNKLGRSYYHWVTIRNDAWTNFYYTVRAVSKGTYKMGPVSAEAMYDGQYHSVYGAATVVVE